MENTSIKEWYVKTFPTDELGCELNDDVTFNDLITALDNYKDVYTVLGGDSDSIIRERVFEKLSNIMGVSYKCIYDQWLKKA